VAPNISSVVGDGTAWLASGGGAELCSKDASPSRVTTGTSITSRKSPLRMTTEYFPSAVSGPTCITPVRAPTVMALVSGSTA
jgi:hypothetical protein